MAEWTPRICEAVPVVLSKEETKEVLGKLEAESTIHGLAAKIQYGAGLRLSEVVRLRIKDVDLERGTVTVRAGKGDKDRMTVLPRSVMKSVAAQIEVARAMWANDASSGHGGVYLPGALARKFR